MHGGRYLDAAVFGERLWTGGFAGAIGSQVYREADARGVRMLTSFLGEATQKVCVIMGSDLLGAYHLQHGDDNFAYISDYRKTFPWPQAGIYPTMSRIHEGHGAGFIRRDDYDAYGQPLENMATFDQQRMPDEAWRYVNDTTVLTVSLDAAADILSTQQLSFPASASQPRLRALRQAAMDNCADRPMQQCAPAIQPTSHCSSDRRQLEIVAAGGGSEAASPSVAAAGQPTAPQTAAQEKFAELQQLATEFERPLFLTASDKRAV
jgi:hypothetical protein